MKKDFAKNPQVSLPRSSFDMSHGHKTTFNGGDLIPIYMQDWVLPGDTHSVNLVWEW